MHDMTWADVRHAIVFALGIATIIDAITSPGNPWPQLAIGAVMVGVLPIDRMVVGMRPVRVYRDGGGGGGR